MVEITQQQGLVQSLVEVDKLAAAAGWRVVLKSLVVASLENFQAGLEQRDHFVGHRELAAAAPARGWQAWLHQPFETPDGRPGTRTGSMSSPSLCKHRQTKARAASSCLSNG